MAAPIDSHLHQQKVRPIACRSHFLADEIGLTAALHSMQATWHCFGMKAVQHCITRRAAWPHLVWGVQADATVHVFTLIVKATDAGSPPGFYGLARL